MKNIFLLIFTPPFHKVFHRLTLSLCHPLYLTLSLFLEPQNLCVKFGGILSESRWGFWVNIVAGLSGAYFNLWFVKQGGKTLSLSSCDRSARPAWPIIVYIREKGKEIQQNESMERDNVFYFLKFFIY